MTMEVKHKIFEIPYVTEDSVGRPDLWPAVGKNISYSESCDLGNERARQVIAYMRSNEDAHMLLAHISTAQMQVVQLYGPYQGDAVAAFWRMVGRALVD